MNKQTIIERIEKAYGQKYDYSLIPNIFTGKEKLHIICPEHGEFEVRADYVGKPKEICPECRKILNSKENFQKIIDKSIEIYGDTLDFSVSNYIKESVPVNVKCKKCGEIFKIRVDHLFDKNRFPCPCCGKTPIDRNMLKDTFIQKSIEKFGDIYDFSNINYVNCRTPIEIVCKKHGPIQIAPNKFIRNACGCPKCGKELGREKTKITFEEFVEKSRKVHGNRYSYEYSQYIDYYTQIKIYDTQQNQFFYQKPFIHAEGKGNPFIHSKGNARINDWLIENNFSFIPEFTIFDESIPNNSHRINVDFMVTYNNRNYFIEYNGIQHYVPQEYFGSEEKFKRQQFRDEWLRTYSKNNNYILVEIPYTYNSYEKISNYLCNIFN